MKLQFSKGTKIILVFLISLLMVLIILKLNQPNEEISETSLITPTPTSEPSQRQSFPAIVEPMPTVIQQGEYNFRETINTEILQAYPLFNFIPFKTENWSIDYTNKMELTVLLKQDTPEIRQEVLDWIIDHGVDPQSHKIIWK